MDRSAIKDIFYGGLEELISNREYYYHSSVSRDYSHFTDTGRQAVLELAELLAYKIQEAEQQDLDRRAKKQVLDQLKSRD